MEYQEWLQRLAKLDIAEDKNKFLAAGAAAVAVAGICVALRVHRRRRRSKGSLRESIYPLKGLPLEHVLPSDDENEEKVPEPELARRGMPPASARAPPGRRGPGVAVEEVGAVEEQQDVAAPLPAQRQSNNRVFYDLLQLYSLGDGGSGGGRPAPGREARARHSSSSHRQKHKRHNARGAMSDHEGYNRRPQSSARARNGEPETDTEPRWSPASVSSAGLWDKSWDKSPLKSPLVLPRHIGSPLPSFDGEDSCSADDDASQHSFEQRVATPRRPRRQRPERSLRIGSYSSSEHDDTSSVSEMQSDLEEPVRPSRRPPRSAGQRYAGKATTSWRHRPEQRRRGPEADHRRPFSHAPSSRLPRPSATPVTLGAPSTPGFYPLPTNNSHSLAALANTLASHKFTSRSSPSPASSSSLSSPQTSASASLEVPPAPSAHPALSPSLSSSSSSSYQEDPAALLGRNDLFTPRASPRLVS